MANPIVQQLTAELNVMQGELQKFKSTVEYLGGAKGAVKEAIHALNNSESYFGLKVDELKSTYESILSLTVLVDNVFTKLDTVDFPERLESIENSVKDTVTYLNETKEATLEELKKASEIIVEADFDGRFQNLESIIERSVSSNEEIANTIKKQKLPEKIDEFGKSITQKLESSFSEVLKNTKQIATDSTKSILDLNLPVRMDKLDANITGILSAIQNVQARIESLERNLSDKIKEASTNQTTAFFNFQEKSIQIISNLRDEMEANSRKHKTNTIITWVITVLSAIIIVVLILNRDI